MNRCAERLEAWLREELAAELCKRDNIDRALADIDRAGWPLVMRLVRRLGAGGPECRLLLARLRSALAEAAELAGDKDEARAWRAQEQG